jgi:hypothetical protein
MVAVNKRAKRRQGYYDWNSYPHIDLACGCRTGVVYCDEAARLWDKVNAANHNLTRTRKAVEKWPITTYKMFGPRRIKVREALYDYRLAMYHAHFNSAAK